MSGELGRFVLYLRRVFKFPALLRRVTDSREDPAIPTSSVLLSLFWGAVLRIPSWLQLEAETKRKRWHRQVNWPKPISDDTFDYVTERLDVRALRQTLVTTNKILKRNKAFEANKHQGLLVASLDGNEQFRSRSRCCEACCQRRITLKNAAGQEEKVTEYYHFHVFCQLSGPHLSVLLDFEPKREGEDEVAAALRLLQRLRENYGPRFFDVVVVDAAFAEGPFIRQVEAMGWTVVSVLKQERYEIWQEAQRLTANQPPLQSWGDPKQEQVDLWEVKALPFTDSHGGTMRVVRSREQGLEVKQVGGKRERVPYDHTWYWLASRNLDGYAAKTIWAIGHSRWKIENNAFNELTQHWQMEHCTHHHPVAIVAWLLIVIWAFNLFHAYAVLCGKSWRLGKTTLQELRRRIDLAMTTDRTVLFFSG